MQFDYAVADRDFVDEVRRFVVDTLDPVLRQKEVRGELATRAERTGWQRSLIARGWGAPNWPVQFGGPGWSVVQRHLFDQVLAEEGAPAAPVFGFGMLAPVLMRFGTVEQKRRLLPRILNLDDWWCQGFSEPGAGSDLASLNTRATANGPDWILNGQKIWTTLAQWADWMFCLVRTSSEPKQQMGLSLMLVNMRATGISVRPIITIDGEHEVNEVFLTDVRVPAADVVGEVGRGWDYAKYLLSHERSGIARIGHSRRQLRRLREIAACTPTAAGPLSEDAVFNCKLAELEIRLTALESFTLRKLIASPHGAAPGAEANLLKIKGSEIQQDIAELMLDAVGLSASRPDAAADVARLYFNLRKVSIYGGSNEIQRNVLARVALGL